MRILLCTFGFDAEKIRLAMRTIRHDRLVLITGPDNLELDSFQDLDRLCQRLGTPLEVLTTDKFDLLSSMELVKSTVERLKAQGHDVCVDIGGGVHTLSMAALLTATNLGLESWHVDREAVRLPILYGVNISSRLSTEQRQLIMQIGTGTSLDRLKLPNGRADSVKRVLLELKRAGMVQVASALPDAQVILTTEGVVCLKNMLRGRTDH